MIDFKRWTVGLFFFTLSFSVKAASPENLRAQDILSDGLKANDELIEFFDSHSCELGIIPNCPKPMAVKDIVKLKELFRKLESWKRDTFDYLIPSTDKIKGREFQIHNNQNHSVSQRLGKLIISLKKNDKSSEKFIEDVAISAAARLVMYDSFFRLSDPMAKAKKMRAILARDMGSEGSQFLETFLVALDPKNWKKTELDLSFLKQAEAYRTKDDTFFDQYIQKSFTAARMMEKDQAFKIRSILLLGAIVTHAELRDALEEIMGKLSEVFGNAIGQIQTREGKLKKLAADKKVMTAMKKKLKPLDILFEKTPFRLTDQFIPGFYGHVAIWMGTPEELNEMTVEHNGVEIPLLEHPKVLPHLERMSQGKLVIEALRKPGVTMNTLEHFLDIDDLVVVQPNNILNPAEHILKALELVGRPYDFNFDVETEGSIVCSELVYQVFDQFDWPTEREMGRHTISPDHVAWKAVDSCFNPIMMFHDGKEVVRNLSGELRQLLERRGGISYTPIGNCL